jgi:hypothetical protein
MLKSKVKGRDHSLGIPNPGLDSLIKLLKHTCPAEFHDAHSLKQRKFWNEPVTLPPTEYINYVVAAHRPNGK